MKRKVFSLLVIGVLIGVFSLAHAAPPAMKTKLGSLASSSTLQGALAREEAAEGADVLAHYDIDPVHSSIGFKIRHLVGIARGVFTRFQGTIELRRELSECRTEAVIETSSIDTNNDLRDKHLRGSDFFEVEKFPEIKFVSKQVEPEQISGNLTLHGVTREIILYYVYHGKAKGPDGKTRIGFSATATLNRKQFGIAYDQATKQGLPLIGDEVPIEIEIEAVRREEG